MTSTNDGKDVKSINSSGHKSKSHYIELYKSLDANLNSDCELGTLTDHVCITWRRVHSLCSHSAPSTHPHLLAWIQRHTARTVLQTDWHSATSRDHHDTLDQTLQDFIQEVGDAIVARNGQCLSWESQLLERAVWIRSVLYNPWEHHVLKALLDANNKQPSDQEVLEWLKEERGISFVTRLRELALSKGCVDLALTLATAIMDRIRAGAVVVADVDQLDDMREKPPLPESEPTFEMRLRSEAGFTQDVLDLLTDIELVLLFKRDRHPHCIQYAKATPLRMGHALVERLAGRLDQTPREKKLWKTARNVAALVAKVIIARCMVIPWCVGVARTALYWCARSVARLVGGDRLPSVAGALAAPAVTARHLHTLATANHAQLAELEDRRGFVCELYIRAITTGMNELEKLKLKTGPDKEKEARQTEQTLASWFIQLGTLLSGSARVKYECMLTAFSVHPSLPMYERIKQAPVLPSLAVESSEIKQEDRPTASKPDFASWANDSHQQTNLVKTSQIVKIETTQDLANVLSTAIYTEGEKLGLDADLCNDLAGLLSRARVKTFSWDMDREVLLEYCRSYMERTSGGTKCLTTELRYLNLDPRTYQHLPQEEDDEDDIYYGIQKGYEHLLKLEPQPEEIWQDAHLTQEESTESDPDDVTYTTSTRRKKKTRQSSESDSDPLSVVAKVKHNKKLERPRKERSKEPKQRGKKDPTKQKPKKELKDKKLTAKKDQQPTNDDSQKPVTCGLSKFLGFKVVNTSFEDEFRSSLQMRTQMDPLGTAPDPLEFNAQSDKKAQDKSTNLQRVYLTPVAVSDPDSQGKSSRKTETPEPDKVSDKNFPVDDLIKSLQKMNNKPNPVVKESISKLLQYRKQKAEEQKTNASRENSLSSLIGTKIYNKQPIMIPNIPNVPKPVVANNSGVSSKSTSTNTEPLVDKSVNSKDSSSAPGQKTRKPSTKKMLNSQTNSLLPSQIINTPKQRTISTGTAPFAKASFDPNQNSYHRFLMELQETKRLALQRPQEPKPAPKPKKVSTPNITTNSEATQSAKPTQQKMETPNTFARRNHMHQTNKRIFQHHESLQFSISREIDQRIANMTQKKMKELTNSNDLSISLYNPKELLGPHFNAATSSRTETRVEIQKVEEPTPASNLIAVNHPVTSNTLHGNVTITRNPAYISPKPDESKVTPGHSALSEQDQKDVLRLLMQQNKLNAKVESLSVGNTSILASPKVYPAKIDSVTDQNHVQKHNLVYGSSIKQETMESPVIPQKTILKTANMVQSPKSAVKRKPKVKNCRKKDGQSPSSPSASKSAVCSKAPSNPSQLVLKTSGNSNQIGTTTVYNFAEHVSSATYESQITAPVSLNTNQSLKRQATIASPQVNQNSPTVYSSAGQIPSKPMKTTGDITATSAVTITSTLKSNVVKTPYTSPSQQKEEWASVLDGILKLKTPCRGITALDMTLNKEHKEATTESLRQLRIVKSKSYPRSVSLERPLETKAEIKSSQDLQIPLKMDRPDTKSPEPFTKAKFLEASKAVDDMIKKIDRKAKRASRVKVKVQNKPVTKELVVRKPIVQYPKRDPIPAGLTRSDYDIMLGELLDDDLLQEIDESPVQFSRQNDSRNSYNNDLIFSKPEERVAVPEYGTIVDKTQVTENIPFSNTTIDEKSQQNSKHIKMVFDIPLKPEIVIVKPKEKPRILSNVPISLGSPGIKNVLPPVDKTSPKIQHPNEILLKKRNTNTNLPFQNQKQRKIVNSVPQNVFLVGSKNSYETLTIYGQSDNETIITPLSSSTAKTKLTKTNAQNIAENVSTPSINKQAVINEVSIKAPYPTVGRNKDKTIKTKTVNTASPSNKHAVHNEAVITAAYPNVNKTLTHTLGFVNTELTSDNKHTINASLKFNAPYPIVGQPVQTSPETVNTPSTSNKHAAVNTFVMLNAPCPTTGQTVKTEKSASTTVNNLANNTSVVFNAPYPTIGQTIEIPTTPDVNTTSTNQNVHKYAKPVVGQTINMTTCNKSGSNVTAAQPEKAQSTAKPASAVEAAQNVINTTKPAPVIEVALKVPQDVIKNTKLANAIEGTPKLQQNTTNTTEPINVVEAKLLSQPSVVEITSKLEENVSNTTKSVPVIESTPNTIKLAPVGTTLKSPNCTNTMEPTSVIEATQKLQQDIANTTNLVAVIESKSTQEIANQNDNLITRINSDTKIIYDVSEKLKIPSKIDIKNNTTLVNKEMKNKNQERLIKKRASIINRQFNHRCFYPPIPLLYAPIMNKIKLEKNVTDTVNGVKKSVAVNKVPEDTKATKSSATKGTPEDIVPMRVSKRIEMRKSKKLLDKQNFEEEQAMINKFIDESLGTVDACDETASEKSKLDSNVQLTDIPKHSNLTDKNITDNSNNNLEKSEPEIDQSSDDKLKKLVSEMATSIDIITKSTVEPVLYNEEPAFVQQVRQTKSTVEPVVYDEEPAFVQQVRQTLLKDPLDIDTPLVLAEQSTSKTTKKDKVSKTEAIADKVLPVTNAVDLPKKANNSRAKKEANLLSNVTRKDPIIKNSQKLETNVVDAQKFKSKDVIAKEKDLEVIDLDSDSDTEIQKLEPEKPANQAQNIASEMSQSFKDSIKITAMSSDCPNPFKQKVRIEMPTGKALIATITGKQRLTSMNFDDLLAIPQFRNVLLNSNALVKCVVTITAAELNGPVATREQNALETVDLLSDDEEPTAKQLTKEKVRSNYFVTEFGQFRTSDHLDEGMLFQHQQKFSQKCLLKLQRCNEPETYTNEELQEEVMSFSTAEPTDIHEKSQEIKDPEPNVIPEVIDLDDSSNDSVVAVDDVVVPDVAPVKKINKFKNLLLKELFSNNISNLNPDDKLNPISEPKSRDSSSVVTILSSDVSAIDLPITRQDYSNIIDKKCVIKLTRCDDIVTNYKQRVTNTESDNALIDVGNLTNDLELTSASSSPVLTRSQSFSILNELYLDTVVDSPVIDVLQAIAKLKNSDEVYREEVTSPVMQAYDIIASGHKKVEAHYIKTVQTVCDADWVYTKPKLGETAKLDQSTSDHAMDSILDELTDYEDSFNTSDKEKPDMIAITCYADCFMTKLLQSYLAKNLNKCEIATIAITNNPTSCEVITDCSKRKSDTEIAVKDPLKLKTIMENYFSDNPIVENMQQLAPLNQKCNATMSPLKRKSTIELSNKSSKISRMLRSKSDSMINISVESLVAIEKPNNTIVPEYKELPKISVTEETNKLKIIDQFNVDQNDNDYLLSQKYSDGLDKHETTKQRIDKVTETEKTTIYDRDSKLVIKTSLSDTTSKDSDRPVEPYASEMLVSDLLVKQDVRGITGMISEMPVKKNSNEKSDTPSAKSLVQECVSEISMENNEPLHDLQDKSSTSETIAEIYYLKNEPCAAENMMEAADPVTVEPCASEEAIVDISDSVVQQDKQSKLISESPDSTCKSCVPDTTVIVADLLNTEPSCKSNVSELALEELKSLEVFQKKPTASKLTSQIPDPINEPCVLETTVKIADPPSVKSYALNMVAGILQIPDLNAVPHLPGINNMENFDLLVNVCLSELMTKDAKSLSELPDSNIESTVEDTKLQIEVPETTVADITLQEHSAPEPLIVNTVVEHRDPLQKVSVPENPTLSNTQEESNETIDWIGSECVIKSEFDSANSSFETITMMTSDDRQIDHSELKPTKTIDQTDLMLITECESNHTLLEHAYEKMPFASETSESTNKIETKSDRELICTDEIEKYTDETGVDELIQHVTDCENNSENMIYNGDDAGVVLKKADSEEEHPFLGFECPDTKSDCCILNELDYAKQTRVLEYQKLYEDDQKLTLIIPKATYAMKRRKRKLVDATMIGNAKRALRPKSTDSNTSVGRKRKSIDARKLSVSAVSEQTYSKEFEQLIRYCDTIDMSYSLSYGVEQVDATELLQNWPIKDEYEIYDGKIKAVELFTDDSEIKPHAFEIDKLTFAEEINAAIEQKIEDLSLAGDINFNKGFGERSGRVIQDLEQFGAILKLSAATLSDVKQYQPFLLSENINNITVNSEEQIVMHATEDYEIMNRFMRGVQLHRKIKQFFKNSANDLTERYNNIKSEDGKMSKAQFPIESGDIDFKQFNVEMIVGVVQVGQLPVSAAAQNPVTCDPRVTHVSDASPSQCSENSPSDDPEQSNKTEYTELTTADLSMPIIGQDYSHSDVPLESHDSYTPCENITIESSLIQSDIRIELEEESPEEADVKIKTEPVQSKHDEFSSEDDPDRNSPHESDSNSQFVLPQQECQEPVVSHQTINGSTNKSDQIAQAMNVAGITNEDGATATANRTRALVDLLTSISQGQTITSQNTTMTYPKTTTINAMSLQQALAQILPPPLNQTRENQQVPISVPQVLHIVHNNPGGNLTLVDGGQQSVINSNTTPMIHIVQNKVSNGCPPGNGVPAQQQNCFSGLSLVDAGLQQGGSQLLHIVNTGNQKNPNTGQILKRVNLLTNLTNVQGSNEQKMLQFVCKSADGKSIQLSSPHQRSMVLRLQPIETVDMQNAQKQTESQDPNPIPANNASNKDSASQQDIKSRSVYEENYAKFIQNSSVKPGSEKSTSLPKFNQAFGKPVFQDGSEKSSDNASDVNLSSGSSNENTDVQSSENTINLDHMTGIKNPPILLRKSTAQVTQAQPNLVQQIKQTIAPMNIQTMHGGVIYTRQIPVNIGAGQTINLISVPTTELADESGQKQPEVQFVKQGDMDGSPSIIKIVPQIPAPNAEVSEDGSVNLQNDGQNPQPQPVLTQMRIKLPMLSKNPQMIAGARVVRPSFFQIQRNVIGGANQPVYQQLVLTAAPQLGQQTIRLPQAQQVRQVKVPDNQSPSESLMSSSTLEQLREFDMVLEQVKERSTVQPNSVASGTSQGNKSSTDSTDSPVSTSSKPIETKQVLYTIGGSHSVTYVNRKATVTTTNTSSFTRSPDSSGIVDSPSSSSQIRLVTSETPQTTQNDGNPTPKSKSHKSKSKSKSSSHSSHSSSKVSTAVAHKPSTQKPLEDEQTTQRILYILAEYKEQVENSPDKDKPAPRRRTNPPSNPGSRRKKRRSGARDVSPTGDDSRTLGSEDSSCGTSQGDCAESCVDSVSPQSSPRKVVNKLTFDPDATPNATSTPPIRPQPPRNVIVADGQTLAVTRGATGKPATAVIMPANYLLPVSMVKGGQQIAIVTNQGPKLLTVTGGESPAANALLLQRLIGPAVKPVLARPGIRHVRLPTAALQRIQTFNLASTATAPATASNSTTADSTASPAPVATPETDPQTSSPPWADKESESKPDRASSPEGSEPWNLPSSADPNDYSYAETVRTDNLDRTVLEAIPDRYSPDMEAHRIFDKMFDVESKKSYVDSPHRYDIDAVDEDKTYQVVQKKDLSAARQHRLAYISAAALRHKHAILEHELRLQKSLSEECEDLGVDSPSASDLFPEAELLFSGSPAADHGHERDHEPPHHPSQLPILNETHPNMEENIATEQLLPRSDRNMTLGLDDVGIVTVSEDGMQANITLDQEEFARSHPNTTFHSEPTVEGEVQQFTLPNLKARHIPSAIYHPNRTSTTVLMTAPQATVISQAQTGEPVKYSHIDNIIQTPRYVQQNVNVNLNSVLVKDDGLTRFDNILTDREIHLSNTASAIVHANTTQVIRRVCYEDDKRDRFLIDEPESVIAGKDAKMVAEDSVADESSPERNTELFWESNSASERSESRRPLDFSSDSDKCCKSPLYDETNSTDSSGVGTHMRLDSVIKEARGVERSRSADGSSADDTHPPLRTYPPKRSYHNDSIERQRYNDVDRSLSGKTRAGFQTEPRHHSPDMSEVRRRASNRGVVKRGCHCCNGSPAPSRPKKSRQKKSHTEFSNNH